jgi:hypothetical protein
MREGASSPLRTSQTTGTMKETDPADSGDSIVSTLETNTWRSKEEDPRGGLPYTARLV